MRSNSPLWLVLGFLVLALAGAAVYVAECIRQSQREARRREAEAQRKEQALRMREPRFRATANAMVQMTESCTETLRREIEADDPRLIALRTGETSLGTPPYASFALITDRTDRAHFSGETVLWVEITLESSEDFSTIGPLEVTLRGGRLCDHAVDRWFRDFAELHGLELRIIDKREPASKPATEAIPTSLPAATSASAPTTPRSFFS